MFFERNSRTTRQQFQSFRKSDPFLLSNKVDNVAVLITSPATVALPSRIYIKGGTGVIVEGAQPLKGWTRRAQGYITAHDIHDVIRSFDLLHVRPVVRQGAPSARTTQFPEDNMASRKTGTLATVEIEAVERPSE
jgi:hypothetical protein